MSAATKQKNIKIKVIKKSAEKKSEEPKKAFLAAKPAHFKKTFDRSDQDETFQKKKATVIIGVALIMLIVVITWFSLLDSNLSRLKSNTGFWGRLMTNMKESLGGIKNSLEGIKATIKTSPPDTNESELEKNIFPVVK
jgi:hypothetical protein